MPSNGRLIGLAISGLMFLFSTWMYLRTGDWVAALFAAGSLAYGIFFLSRSGGGTS